MRIFFSIFRLKVPVILNPGSGGNGFVISSTHFYRPFELPVPGNMDLLIIMGGSMSVNDEEKLPWLVQEKQFIRGIISEGKPVLGICLGSQLIASALGAKVYPNHEKEIGWFTVQGINSPDPEVFRFPKASSHFTGMAKLSTCLPGHSGLQAVKAAKTRPSRWAGT